jgi:hypothetical protein
MNWQILEKNEEYSAVSKEWFREHYSQKPQKDTPQSTVSMTDTEIEAVWQEWALEPSAPEPERDRDLESDL